MLLLVIIFLALYLKKELPGEYICRFFHMNFASVLRPVQIPITHLNGWLKHINSTSLCFPRSISQYSTALQQSTHSILSCPLHLSFVNLTDSYLLTFPINPNCCYVPDPMLSKHPLLTQAACSK